MNGPAPPPRAAQHLLLGKEERRLRTLVDARVAKSHNWPGLEATKVFLYTVYHLLKSLRTEKYSKGRPVMLSAQ
jgi:hypothetical protein